MSASLYEFRDLDLMMVLHAEGEMASGQLADALGIKDAHAIGSRGAWMRRFGMFEHGGLACRGATGGALLRWNQSVGLGADTGKATRARGGEERAARLPGSDKHDR